MKHKPIRSQKTKVSADSDHKVPCMLAMSMFHDMWHELVDDSCINSICWHVELPDTQPPIRIVFVAAAVQAKDADAIGEVSYKALSDKMLECYGLDSDAKTN
jgi:hypothetical protein